MSRPVPRLHVVTDDAVLARTDFARRAESVLEAGGGDVALHLRGPHAEGRALFELAERLIPVARRAGATLLVNDRVDVALAAGADGAHLGARSLPVADARAILGDGALIGRSLHDAAEADAAALADYALFGAVHATSSHPGREGAGEAALAACVAAVAVPVVAIGGITPARVADALATGAAGVAVLSGVWGAADAADAVVAYRAALDR